MSIDPLRDGNIKNKMGIIGYTDRRLRDYKYNPEIIPHNINISYHPLPPPPNNPPNIPKPTSNKDNNNNNNNKKNAAIGLIFIVIVIFIVIANVVNFYLNMQDVKYFQDRVNEEQNKVNELTPPSSTGTTTTTK